MKLLRIITLLSIMLYFSIDAYGKPGKKPGTATDIIITGDIKPSYQLHWIVLC